MVKRCHMRTAASSRHRVEENGRETTEGNRIRKEVQMVSEGSIFQKQQQKERARSHKQHEATLKTLCIQDQS